MDNDHAETTSDTTAQEESTYQAPTLTYLGSAQDAEASPITG